MKKLIIAIAAIIALASCKKENVTTAVNTTPVVTKNLVKSVRVFDNGTPETEDFTFGVDGRIFMYKNNNRTSTFNFISSSSFVVSEKNNADNSLYRTYESTLNNKGYVTQIVIKNATGVLVYTYDFTYNEEGYLTNQKSTSATGSTVEEIYVIANGNPVSSKLYYNNVLSNSREYGYDAVKTNNTQLSYAGYWVIPGLFGKSSKNMWVEFKDFNLSGTLSWHSQITYDLDADGYPVKQTTNYILLGKQAVTNYTYQ